MFGQGDLPDFTRIFRTLGVLAVVGVVLGGVELVRLIAWAVNHVRISP